MFKVLVSIVMKEHKNKDDDAALNLINRISWCFVVFAFVDLFKTLGCRLLSLRVNAESLFDLLKVRCLQ